MSAALAIAGVSAALEAMLTQGLTEQRAAMALGTMPTVSVRPPRADDTADGANAPELCLFLYRVAENGSLRNIALPTGGAEDRTRHDPALALDLHYLLTSKGTSRLQSEVLLGSALLTLSSSPVLRREAVRTALQDAFGDLGLAPLEDRLTIALTNLRLDELTQLWRALQAPFRASVTFQVSVLLKEYVSGTGALPHHAR